MADRGQGGGAGLDNFIFAGDATSPAPFGMSSAGLWDEVEVGGTWGRRAGGMIIL